VYVGGGQGAVVGEMKFGRGSEKGRGGLRGGRLIRLPQVIDQVGCWVGSCRELSVLWGRVRGSSALGCLVFQFWSSLACFKCVLPNTPPTSPTPPPSERLQVCTAVGLCSSNSNSYMHPPPSHHSNSPPHTKHVVMPHLPSAVVSTPISPDSTRTHTPHPPLP